MAFAIPFVTAAVGAYSAISSVQQANKQEKASKEAASQAAAQNAAQMAALKASQENASTKAAQTIAVKKRAVAGSNTVYTSPLGLSGQADVSRKTLLGQ